MYGIYTFMITIRGYHAYVIMIVNYNHKLHNYFAKYHAIKIIGLINFDRARILVFH
jgi:hypothetical protein